MKKSNKQNQIIRREFTLDPYQGAAAMFSGTSAEGLPLLSLTRKGKKVICIYGTPNQENRSEFSESA